MWPANAAIVAVIDRVIVFLDEQNAARHARERFFPGRGSYRLGQLAPDPGGALLEGKGPQGADRRLESVRVYTGVPDAEKQPAANAAFSKQRAAWLGTGAEVIARPLQYHGWPGERPRQKGVDVQLAVDVVRLGVEQAYDVGIVFSSDTDLAPAIEFIVERAPGGSRIETAAWFGRPGIRNAAGRRIWCHFLDRADYDAVHDPTDYSG